MASGKTEDGRRKTQSASAAFRLGHYDLEVWKDAMRLVRLCYEATRSFPQDEKF